MKKLQKERKKTEKPAPPVIPTPQQKEKEFLDHLGTQINNIMHCDEPDWDEIDRQIAENKQREAELASYENTRDHSAESIHCSKLRNPPFVGRASARLQPAEWLQPLQAAKQPDLAPLFIGVGEVRLIADSNCKTPGHAATAASPQAPPAPTPARNRECPCGSRKKFKHCCGKRTPQAPGKAA